MAQDPRYLPEKLLQSRRGTGWSTRTIADILTKLHIHISHATLANYEAGRTVPSIPTLAALAGIYGRPLHWFLERGTPLTGVRYRCRQSRLRVGEMHAYEALTLRWLEAYQRVEHHLNQRLVAKLDPASAPRSKGPVAMAGWLRARLGIDEQQPVVSVVEALEAFGIRVIELRTDLPIDGLAARFGDEFAVTLNPSSANDRCRMNAAHELAHVLLGDCESTDRAKKEEEGAAYELASHFLLPEAMLRAAFDGRSMVRLVKFKERFGISLAAMIYRAKVHGIITENLAKRLWIQFAQRGWRTNEPGNVRPDRATRFEQLIDGAVMRKRLTWSSAADLACVREQELQDRMHQAMGTYEPAERGCAAEANELHLKLVQ